MRILISILILVLLDTTWVQAFQGYSNALPELYSVEYYESGLKVDQFEKQIELSRDQDVPAIEVSETKWLDHFNTLLISYSSISWQFTSNFNVSIRPTLLFIRICPQLFEVNLRISG